MLVKFDYISYYYTIIIGLFRNVAQLNLILVVGIDSSCSFHSWSTFSQLVVCFHYL